MRTPDVVDPLVTSWFETVQALPTTEEREELSHFIRHDLRLGVGAGILRGLFLLLKANRLYLDHLPDKYNQELVQPIRDQFHRQERILSLKIDAETQLVTRNEKAAETSARAAKSMENMVPRVERIVQDSVNKIDTGQLTHQITETILKSTVEPVAKTNRELQKLIELLDRLLEKVQEVCASLQQIAWKQVFVGSFCVAFAVWAIVFEFAYHGMKNSFDASLELQDQKLKALEEDVEKVHSTAVINQPVFDELAHLNATLDLAPAPDVPGHYVLTLPGADAAQIQDGKGAILFHGIDIYTLLKQQNEENQKLLNH